MVFANVADANKAMHNEDEAGIGNEEDAIPMAVFEIAGIDQGDKPRSSLVEDENVANNF